MPAMEMDPGMHAKNIYKQRMVNEFLISCIMYFVCAS